MTIAVEYETFNTAELPLVVKPGAVDGPIDIDAAVRWVLKEKKTLAAKLHRHGALLFRGFPISTADDFSRLVRTFDGDALDYIGGAVPRSRINGIVFNATELTRLYKIRMHNELAYQRDYPDLVFFYCNLAAQEGGETTIVDCRSIYQDLSPSIREKFMQKGLKYVRTFQEKRTLREWFKKFFILYQHMTWQDAFKVKTRQETEQRCCERGMEYMWRANGDLAVSNVFPAAIRHPVTGEHSWFNQVVIQHFNKRNYGRLVHLFRRSLYRDRSGLPNQVYFGDGTSISEEEIYHVMDVTDKHTVQFPWQSGDVLLVDNRLVAHGRNPYKGPRKVYVAMLDEALAAVAQTAAA